MRHPVLDELDYPPFHGFPPDALRFLRLLKRNNNRPWFQKHKQDYEEHVRFPMQCLIAGLAVRLADIAPEVTFDPKRSIFRIYRDVRFSNNKAPYKTNIAASFEVKGRKGPTESPGLYVGIEPGEIYIGGGVYMPWGDQLKAIRRSIAEHPDEYLAVVEDRRFKKRFGGIQGENLAKAPLGYPKDHPMIEHLRHKQFYTGIELKDAACESPRFLDTVAGVFADIMPLVRWIDRATRSR
ncbi:MAG: DUF2461 domain-containing protein [Bacteroidota bacterium]